MLVPKIICLDIDGTFLKDDKSVSEENLIAIKRVVKERGVLFCFISGRIYSAITPYYDILGLRGVTSALNGALFLDERGRIVHSREIKPSVVVDICRIAEECKIDLAVISNLDWFTETKDSYLYRKKRELYRKDAIMLPLLEVARERAINKILSVGEDKIALSRFLKELKREIEDATIYFGDNFIEIMPFGVNKGLGLDDISTYLGIDKDEIMAIGDDYNDIPMLKKAAFSFAMANSKDEIKRSARYLTDTNNNSGVAKAIKSIFN